MNLLDRIGSVARETSGDRPVLSDKSGSWDYPTLFRAAARVRSGLLDRDLSRGNCVGIFLPVPRYFAASLLGISAAGMIPVPVNWLLSPDRIQYIEEKADLAGVITDGDRENLFQSIRIPYTEIQDRTDREPDNPIGFLLDKSRETNREDITEEAVVLFTSGTTARPKGVILTNKNLLSNIRGSEQAISLGPEDSFCAPLPLFHSFALTGGLLLPLCTGASTILHSKFTPKTSLRTLSKEGVNTFLATPSQYRAMVRQAGSTSGDFLEQIQERSIRLISGGEALPDVVAERVQETFGNPVLQGYGLTETSPVVSLNRPGKNRPGTVGRPLDNVDVRIGRPDEPSEPVTDEPEGEIQVKGPSVMKGYLGVEKKNSDVFTKDGWFRTGDRGRLDDDGFLSVTGRLNEMIVRRGENIAPAEIENELLHMNGVQSAAVVGKTDEAQGEVPVGFIVPGPEADITRRDVRSFLQERLANHKLPADVVVSDDLPIGPTGKILKKELEIIEEDK